MLHVGADAGAMEAVSMKIRKPHTLTAALTALSVAAAMCGVIAAPAQAQTHSHDPAAAPHTLTLDHGRKWATDAPLRDGMGRIHGLVEPQIAAAHAGKLSAAQSAALATKIETEVAGIVANCKLDPKADAVLHVVIGEIGSGTDALAGKTPGRTPEQGLVQVASAVNDYGQHFQHPGFRPLRVGH